MRVMLLVAAVLAALAFVLSGCSGDEEQQQTQQSQQPQARAQHQQDATSARPQPAQSEQSSPTQSETGQAAAEPQREEPARQDDAAARFDDPLLEDAYAAFTAWSEGLESIVLDVEADFNLAGLAARLSATVSAEFEPLTILTTLDATELLGMFGDSGAGAADGEDVALLMAILMTEDAVYLTMPMAGGWIDLTSEAEGVLEGLTGMLGGDPAELADPAQLGLAFGCIETVGGLASVGSHEGESAWIIECEIDVETVNDAAATALREQGIEVVDAGIEAMHLRLTISQETGAPLLIETEMTLADAFGFADDEDDDQTAPGFYINTVTHLASWNEPIEFPAPEPLVDGSMVDAFAASPNDGADGYSSGQSDPPPLLDAGQLLDLASQWAAGIDEFHLQFVATATIDGESRLAATISRGSLTQGAFETAVNIDDGSTYRLLWNRDGIWVSDSEENGAPIWAPSSPALLGFAGRTVDDFLGEPDRFDLEPLHALLGLAWVTRTTEGDRPPVYELVIESGYLVPGDPHFDQIVEMLKADTAELLAENVSVEQIDHFSLTINLMGDDGELVSQVTTAEFITNAGRVELLASLNLVSEGPIVFSTPPE
ncbi:MAG: hypothetical protein OXN86_04900 [Chloroflexota bacterium]|nr:hypothetical protein [Chloroflexota bacterium]MDE2891824.1 hypothetical protein [Chloroflexota bacterium]